MNLRVQAPTTDLPVAATASPLLATDWRAALAADGIRLTPTEAIIRGDGRIHVLERDGQPAVRLPIPDEPNPFRTMLRVRMAMGVLPPAAAFFADKLNPHDRALLERLFTKGALQPEESDVRYDGNPDRRLYTKANNLSVTREGLELSFGTDSGDGPGLLKLQNMGGYLKASVVFEYFGSRATSLLLDDSR